MRRSSWLGACIATACAQPASEPSCSEAARCAAAHDVQLCVWAEQRDLPATSALCELAWRNAGDEAAAVAGAFFAADTGDRAALQRWVDRAKPTPEGARILHLWGEAQLRDGDVPAAEATLQRSLDLQVDGEPARASNTALFLLALSQTTRPANESIWLARLAWQQAGIAHSEVARACAAISLLEVLLDLGELSTAAALIERMDTPSTDNWQDMRDSAMARLEAARGHRATAIALFRRASQVSRRKQAAPQPLLPYDAIELVQTLLHAGQTAEARQALVRAADLVANATVQLPDVASRLAAAQAAVELAEGKLDDALATVDRGLAIPTGDAAHVLLLNVRGDARMLQRDRAGAEAAWRAAADSVERWRMSIPTTELRGGLLERHRHALESWLESTGERGDVDGALEVTQRIIGRELLDRIYQREVNAIASVDADLDRILNRLGGRRELGVTMDAAIQRGKLRDLQRDVAIFMVGARSVWAIRHIGRRWSIARVGQRSEILDLSERYRRAIDDRGAAAQLGAALFPAGTLPRADAPLAVMLDRDLAELALPSLVVGGRYLVEHAPILEVLAPDLLFAPVADRSWARPIAVGDPLGNLPDAAVEVRAAARASHGEARIGPAATSAAVEEGRGASLLHVATHSQLANGESAFVLADGALSAREIAARRIAPRLAVIATCRSQVNSDPSASLVAAFLAAGSPAVVGVKRSLDDRDGAALMSAFYGFQWNEDPLRALALAQRKAIAEKKPPGAWATVSFFGVGGWIRL